MKHWQSQLPQKQDTGCTGVRVSEGRMGLWHFLKHTFKVNEISSSLKPLIKHSQSLLPGKAYTGSTGVRV
jgi:hypothetical protein